MLRTIFLAIIMMALVALAVLGWIWYFSVGVTASMPISTTGYTVEALAVNITILQIVMGMVGVSLTVLGLFGWASLKSIAVDIAEKEARSTVTAQLLKLRDAERGVQGGMGENVGSYGVEQQSVDDATPASEAE